MSDIAAEKNFENKIKNFLNSKGCWCVKFFANSFTKVGIPDLICCVNGYFVGIEVKAEKGKPSELQLWNKEKIRESGGICIVLYPNQFEDFKCLISDLLRKSNSKEIWLDQQQFDKEVR